MRRAIRDRFVRLREEGFLFPQITTQHAVDEACRALLLQHSGGIDRRIDGRVLGIPRVLDLMKRGSQQRAEFGGELLGTFE